MNLFQAVGVFLARLYAAYCLLIATFNVAGLLMRVVTGSGLPSDWASALYLPHLVIAGLLLRFAVPIGRRLGAGLQVTPERPPQA